MHAAGDIPVTIAPENYHSLCDQLSGNDTDLRRVIDLFGYPPLWARENNFETLVHIILEQQVSLASALAALNKLKDKTTVITPDTLLRLSDQEMKACYVSRQKMAYIRGLAHSINNHEIELAKFTLMRDDDIRTELISLKGIGNWTIDIYLMMALGRTDIFPIGDLAAASALKRLKHLPVNIGREDLLNTIVKWAPLRSIGCMILWHYYLSDPARRALAKTDHHIR
ncbi:MAG TPA: hypothetical protein VGN64_20060 [Dyadobacter sp.]|jgi:DNA-3-methyladenine glycosylase II|nr:hypothetical protein [Dyadobacter sp.]